MLEVLHFVFSSFWTWAGTVVIVIAFGEAVGFWIKCAGRKT
jgi:hypothetical protein